MDAVVVAVMSSPLKGDSVLLVKKWSWFGAVGAKLSGRDVNPIPDVAVVKVRYGSTLVANADPATAKNSKTAHLAFLIAFRFLKHLTVPIVPYISWCAPTPVDT